MPCGFRFQRKGCVRRGGPYDQPEIRVIEHLHRFDSSSKTLNAPMSGTEKIMEDAVTPRAVEFLILGAGWTSIFLIPALKHENIHFAATTTNGHDDTIPFKFDPSSEDSKPFEVLPSAKTILITFPLKGKGQSKLLTKLYGDTHPHTISQWIQLGSTGVFTQKGWSDHTSPINMDDPRAVAEEELLAVGNSTILNLSGLYDDEIRRPQNWVARVAPSKKDIKAKTNVHLIHGKDVAHGIIGAHLAWDKVKGQRWALTDLFSYDWYSLLMSWGGILPDGTDVKEAVLELMFEQDLKALTRVTGSFERAVDARAFWKAIGRVPQEGSIYHK